MSEMASLLEKTIEGAFQGDALAYLVSIYKDPTKPDDVRIDAAKAAIRYERAPFAPAEHVVDRDFVPLHERLKAYAARDAAAISKFVR